MRIIAKRELKNYLKNPIFWVGILFVAVELFQLLCPYLQLHYFASQQELAELETVTEENRMDADITDGYVRSTKNEQMELMYMEGRQELIDVLHLTEEEADQFMDELLSRNLDVDEMTEYVWEYAWQRDESDSGFPYGFRHWYDISEYHKGDLEEVNSYIRKNLAQHSYSWYFSRKYADFCGLFLGFFSAVMLAFLYTRDVKGDTYELLHTKPVSAAAYILGKTGGGFFAMVFAWGLLTLLFGGLCELHGRMNGFPVSIWDFLGTAVVYVLPNLLMVASIYTVAALLFKNPLPAVPCIFVYMIYSNMGSRNAEGVYGYYGRPLAIMVRFPGRFFESAPPPMAAANQIFLLAASALLLALSAVIWKRRRVY